MVAHTRKSANTQSHNAEQLDMFAEAALERQLEAERVSGVPSLYAQRYSTVAEYSAAMDAWREAWGSFGCRRVSHGWDVSLGEYATGRGLTDHCVPITLAANLGCEHYSQACSCVGDLVFRSLCRGCGWHSAVVDDDTTAAILGLDHCFPGWRHDPIVPSPPYDDGPKRKHRLAWEATVAELHGTDRPDGYPIITYRGSSGTRAVPGRSLWNGYDVAAETLGREEDRR